MAYQIPEKCPACGGRIGVSNLRCTACSTNISGEFEPCRFCSLSPKHALFLEAFLKSRGSIKEVERELGISYPTVKSILEELLSELYGEKSEKNPETSAEVLDMLENKTITAAQAAQLLKNINNRRQ